LYILYVVFDAAKADMRITMKHVPGLTMLASAALLLTLTCNPVLARESHADKGKQTVLYPDATRVAPKLDLTSRKEQKALNEGLDASNSGDKAKAEQLLQPIVDSSKSKYAQALALEGLATVKYNAGDYKNAIPLLQRSLAIGVMPNDTYFQIEYMLAQVQLADEQYQASLDTLAKWRAEGKKVTASSYALEGNADYRLGKYPEAIAAINKAKSLTDKPQDSWNQILMASYSEAGQGDQAAKLAEQELAAKPSDPDVLNNAVAVFMQAQKYPEAIQLMEKARASGAFTKEDSYITLAKLYLVTGQAGTDAKANGTKAEQVLEEGLGKGLVTANADNYLLLGQAAEMADNVSKAIDAYDKAIPTDADGMAALRAGSLLLNENKYAQARGMFQQAIKKGVKHMGTAYMLLAESERNLHNRSAAIAAMKMAAQQPETAEKAKAWLKKQNIK
jgi:tetratricopeptide (TPR) repeat protein